VNVKTWQLNELKSDYYHIILERLNYVMLHGYLDDDVWKELAELTNISIDNSVLKKSRKI
jgi:hypothetical protein